MFAREISLWTGGPVLTLGEYFIWLRYLVAIGFLLLAIAMLLRRRPSLLVGGSIVLAAGSWLAFDFPLGRPYGLAAGRAALVEIGEPMVAAATRSSSLSAVVGEPNSWPGWSFLLALSSGFDPERLLYTYRWVPFASIVLLSTAAYVSVRGLVPPSSNTDMAAALSVFFLLFLSVPRLAFLEAEPLLWSEAFWLRPRLGVSLSVVLLALRGFATAERVREFLLAGLLLGVAGWIEPRWLVPAGAGVALWSFLSFLRREPVWVAFAGLGAAVGVYLLWPASLGTTSAEGIRTWYSAVDAIFSVTLDQGAVFYLGLFGVVALLRGKGRRPLLLASCAIVAYVLFLAASLSGGSALALDRGLAKAFLRVVLACAAGLGAHELLLRLEGFHVIGGRSAYAVGLALLPALALPWVFPFWWNPVRMDPVYVESFDAISREHAEFGAWIRESTSPDAVFLTGPSYAGWVPALAGRRVLGRDDLDPERARAREWIVVSRDPERIRNAAELFHVTHFAWGRLDAGEPLAIDFEFLETSPLFHLVHQQRRFVRVFEIRHPVN